MGNAIDIERFWEVRNFLLSEMDVLDDRAFDEWLDMLTEDVTYQVPVRRMVETAEAGREFRDAYHIDDDRYRLERRVDRLQTDYAWAEQPPSRTRHFLSNIRVVEGDAPDEVEARSNLLLYVSRGTEGKQDFLAGDRHDVLRSVDGSWRLAKRTVYPDDTTLPLDRVSVFI